MLTYSACLIFLNHHASQPFIGNPRKKDDYSIEKVSFINYIVIM
jgi:hypothetical protein